MIYDFSRFIETSDTGDHPINNELSAITLQTHDSLFTSHLMIDSKASTSQQRDQQPLVKGNQ